MPKVSPLQSSFNGGEFSPLLHGRVDVDRYKTGLAVCENYLPTIQGPLVRRSGSVYVARTAFDSLESRLVSFEFSTTQSYILEFGQNYIRFFKDGGAVTKSTPSAAWNILTNYAQGDWVSYGGNQYYADMANVGLQPDLSPVQWNLQDEYQIVTPYLAIDLAQLKFTQSADVLYIVHPDYAPRKLTRTDHDAWTLSTISFLDGPYLPENSTATTITPSATTGNITLTASENTFVATDVNRLIRLKHGATWGWATITAYTSEKIVTATVGGTLGGVGATAVFRLGLWSSTTGYPRCVVFHEDRLMFAGADAAPQRFDGSNTSDYENFAPTETDGSVTSANAVGFSLNANDVNVVRWLASDEKGLLAGTVGGEWVIRPSSSSEALSPTNVSAKRATSYGSADIQPVQVGKAVLFVQRAGRKVREFTYFYDVDGFRANDVTLLAEHITGNGVVDIAYQKEPQSLIWCVRDDGVLACMTYERDIESVKVGWSRHILGGDSDAAGTNAKVESVAVIPSPDGTSEQAWVIVKRWVNGQLRRYVEYFERFFDDLIVQEDAFFVDSGLTYDAPITITGASTANPVVITSVGHGLNNGDRILITDVLGMDELNTNTYTVANKTANTFELSGVNGLAYTPYISGGEARKYVTTISGLDHLEGETVTILADGAVQPNKTVSSGAITLSNAATTVNVGLGYSSRAQMLRLEAGAADGTALGKTRRTHRVGFMVHRLLGMKLGTDFDSLTTLTFRRTSDRLTRAPGLFSGIFSETLDANYDFENQICWEQDQPLPGTILAVMPQMVTQDRG